MSHYHSTTTEYSSENGNKFHRKIVSITNGTGYKKNETLTSNGEVVDTNTQTLSPNEVHSIMNRVFLPGFWGNCRVSIHDHMDKKLTTTASKKNRTSKKSKPTKESKKSKTSKKNLPTIDIE